MFRILGKFWSFLERSQGLAVWERRASISLLCLLFVFGQSVPAALAMVSDASDSWAVVCTGAGLQVIQTDENGSSIPTGTHVGCTCCLAPNSVGYSPEVPHNSLSVPFNFYSVAYNSSQYCNSGHLSRQGLSCRGPPSEASSLYTFSDPPDGNIGVTDWYLRRFWL